MNKILISGFKGNNNSAKILLDNFIENKIYDVLYLDNDFDKSEIQLINKIKNNEYGNIFIFGQKPVIKSIYIEKIGQNNNNKLETNFNYNELNDYLKEYYRVIISENAGKYLCNNIYYKGLKYIFDNKLNANIIFIHIPYIKNIDVNKFGILFIKYITGGQMKTKLNHVRVNVNDIEKAVKWYETVLGFECNGIDINEKWAYADFKNETGAVFALAVDKNVPSHGRYNFDVDDVDSLWEKIKDKAEVIQNIETMPYGTRKFTIKDLDGNELGFVQQKKEEK